ncbi:hypothetical protein EV424DRAFT_1604526 [Suillus variegatus]|nr:hypothetical protein EV424DRAFT_1604526 [Suillus variegatus]
MSMGACTSPIASLEDVVMTEAELSSLPELLDMNSLKPPDVQRVSIRVCEDTSAEYNQQSIETSRKYVFSQASLDAPPSQCSQPFKSLSNQKHSPHPSLPLAQIQSQHSDGHRRKRRRLEEHTSDVPETEHSGVIQVTSLVSALRCRKTEESIDGPHDTAHPYYRSFRVPSPDPFLDTTGSSSHKHEQRPLAILPRNLASSQSAPLLVSPPQLEISSQCRGQSLAMSSSSVLVTLTSSRTIAPAPTKPLLLGKTSTISLASSSKVPRHSLVVSENSSSSRSRKRQEIAEKLCLARPDLVDPSYAVKQSRRLSRLKERSVSIMQDMSSSAFGSSPSHSISAQNNGPSSTMVRREFKPASRLSSFSTSKHVAGTAVRDIPAKRWREPLDEDTEDVHQTMNWERSRRLALDVTRALAAGRKARDVLPRLMCTSARQRRLAG